MNGLPLKLKVAAFAIGGWIAKVSPGQAARVVLFLLAVARVIIKATPDKADDAVLTIVAPIVEQVAEALKNLGDDE